MRKAVSLVFTSGFLAVAALASAQPVARGRGVPEVPGGAMFDFIRSEIALGPIVVGAPYSAEGVTTTTQTLGDGTRIERTTTTKLYRDSEGRVRREQTIVGLSGVVTTGEMDSVTIVDPVARVMYSLVPAKRSGVRSPMPTLARESRRDVPPPPPPPPAGDVSTAGAAPPPPPPPPPGARGRGVRGSGERVPNMPESLGTRQIEGLTAIGTKRSEVIPVGRIGNDRPIEVTDERWESPDLKALVLSRHHDPRTGDVEYRLTNIIRAEPARDLFTPPSDYSIVDAPPPPPPAPRRPE
jgi:hypothetical protein